MQCAKQVQQVDSDVRHSCSREEERDSPSYPLFRAKCAPSGKGQAVKHGIDHPRQSQVAVLPRESFSHIRLRF